MITDFNEWSIIPFSNSLTICNTLYLNLVDHDQGRRSKLLQTAHSATAHRRIE